MRSAVDNESIHITDVDQAVPSTGVSSISYRHAGCMMRWIVVQSSVSVFAAEALWKLTFPEGSKPEPWPSLHEDWRPTALLTILVVMLVVYVFYVALFLFGSFSTL